MVAGFAEKNEFVGCKTGDRRNVHRFPFVETVGYVSCILGFLTLLPDGAGGQPFERVRYLINRVAHPCGFLQGWAFPDMGSLGLRC